MGDHLSTFRLTAYDPAYADKAEQEASKDAMVFNCTQREAWFLALSSFCLPQLRNSIGAHQNTLENVPVIVTT